MRKFWIFLACFIAVMGFADENVKHWKFKDFKEGKAVFKNNKRNFKCDLKDLKFISFSANLECLDDKKQAKILDQKYEILVEKFLKTGKKQDVLADGISNESRICDIGKQNSKFLVKNGIVLPVGEKFSDELKEAKDKKRGIFGGEFSKATKCILGEK